MCVMAPYKKQGTAWGAAWTKKQRLGSTREHCCEREEQASQVVLEVTNPPANAGDMKDNGLNPRVGKIPGEGHGNPLQYSCLEIAMDRGAWWATVHGVVKSLTQLSNEHLLRSLTVQKGK